MHLTPECIVAAASTRHMSFALSSPISTSVRWAAVAPGPRVARRTQHSEHQGIQAVGTKHMVYTSHICSLPLHACKLLIQHKFCCNSWMSAYTCTVSACKIVGMPVLHNFIKNVASWCLKTSKAASQTTPHMALTAYKAVTAQHLQKLMQAKSSVSHASQHVCYSSI